MMGTSSHARGGNESSFAGSGELETLAVDKTDDEGEDYEEECYHNFCFRMFWV